MKTKIYLLIVLLATSLAFAAYNDNDPQSWNYNDPQFYDDISVGLMDIYNDNFDITWVSPNKIGEVMDRYILDFRDPDLRDGSKKIQKFEEMVKKLDSEQIDGLSGWQQKDILRNFRGDLTLNPTLVLKYLQNPDGGLGKSNLQSIKLLKGNKLSADGTKIINGNAELDISSISGDVVSVSATTKNGKDYFEIRTGLHETQTIIGGDSQSKISMIGDRLYLDDTEIELTQGYTKIEKTNNKFFVETTKGKALISQNAISGYWISTQDGNIAMKSPTSNIKLVTENVDQLSVDKLGNSLRIRESQRTITVPVAGNHEVEFAQSKIVLKDTESNKRMEIETQNPIEKYTLTYTKGRFEVHQKQGTFWLHTDDNSNIRHYIGQKRDYEFTNLGDKTVKIKRMHRSDYDKGQAMLELEIGTGTKTEKSAKHWFLEDATMRAGGSIKLSNNEVGEVDRSHANFAVQGDTLDKPVTHFVSVDPSKGKTEVLFTSNDYSYSELRDQGFVNEWGRIKDPGSVNRVAIRVGSYAGDPEVGATLFEPTNLKVTAVGQSLQNSLNSPLEVTIMKNRDQSIVKAEIIQGAGEFFDTDAGTINSVYELKKNFRWSTLRLSHLDQQGNILDEIYTGVNENIDDGEFFYKHKKNTLSTARPPTELNDASTMVPTINGIEPPSLRGVQAPPPSQASEIEYDVDVIDNGLRMSGKMGNRVTFRLDGRYSAKNLVGSAIGPGNPFIQVLPGSNLEVYQDGKLISSQEVSGTVSLGSPLKMQLDTIGNSKPIGSSQSISNRGSITLTTDSKNLRMDFLQNARTDLQTGYLEGQTAGRYINGVGEGNIALALGGIPDVQARLGVTDAQIGPKQIPDGFTAYTTGLVSADASARGYEAEYFGPASYDFDTREFDTIGGLRVTNPNGAELFINQLQTQATLNTPEGFQWSTEITPTGSATITDAQRTMGLYIPEFFAQGGLGESGFELRIDRIGAKDIGVLRKDESGSLTKFAEFNSAEFDSQRYQTPFSQYGPASVDLVTGDSNLPFFDLDLSVPDLFDGNLFVESLGYDTRARLVKNPDGSGSLLVPNDNSFSSDAMKEVATFSPRLMHGATPGQRGVFRTGDVRATVIRPQAGDSHNLRLRGSFYDPTTNQFAVLTDVQPFFGEFPQGASTYDVRPGTITGQQAQGLTRFDIAGFNIFAFTPSERSTTLHEMQQFATERTIQATLWEDSRGIFHLEANLPEYRGFFNSLVTGTEHGIPQFGVYSEGTKVESSDLRSTVEKIREYAQKKHGLELLILEALVRQNPDVGLSLVPDPTVAIGTGAVRYAAFMKKDPITGEVKGLGDLGLSRRSEALLQKYVVGGLAQSPGFERSKAGRFFRGQALLEHQEILEILDKVRKKYEEENK